MNYKESDQIWEAVRKAERIIITCHPNPDPDAIGAALALYRTIGNLDKKIKVVSADSPDESLNYLKDYRIIEVIEPKNFDFGWADLVICPDSSSKNRILGREEIITLVPLINIDHHLSNTNYGKINLVDAARISTCEIIYRVFQDLNVKIDAETGQCLLTGIIGDSGVFRYPLTSQETLRVAANLIELGADNHKIVSNLYNSYDLNYFRFWQEVFGKMKIQGNFVWAAIPYYRFKDLGGRSDFKEVTASLFFQSVKNTDFGIFMVEQEEGLLTVSFRSRTNFDVTKLAKDLGGGGHKAAAAARISDLPFDLAVKKVLATAKKYA